MSSPFVVRVNGDGRSPDLVEVRRALVVLAHPSYAIELRAIPSGRFRVLPGKDIDAICRAVSDLSGDRFLYFCLNPLPLTLKGAAHDEDVEMRHWMLIDVDPNRPKEHKDDSSTDAEHEATLRLAKKIRSWLTDEFGWPDPILVDSGNGTHLLYRIDLPKGELSQAIVRAILYGLAYHFDCQDGHVDKSVHNASRISKLPGTWSRKGNDTADRPHRMARILEMAQPVDIVDTERLQEVVAYFGSIPKTEKNGKHDKPIKTEPKKTANPLVGHVPEESPNGTTRYGNAALESELKRLSSASDGDRNNSLNRSAFSLSQLISGGEIDEGEACRRLKEEAERIGLDRDKNCGPRGIEKTIASGMKAGKEKPRKAPERPEEKSASEGTPPEESIIVLASDIVPKKVQWLWPGRIPLGKLTTFAGVGGLGKTFVLCDIAARVSRGLEWPFSGGECAPRGRVLFVTGEDDYDDTIVPRMIEAGADLNRIAFLKTEIQDRFTLRDLKTLTRAADEIGDDLRFIAIDPPTAFLGGVDDHKNAELRGLLSPLKSWVAAPRSVALVFNTHVTKPQGTKVEAMMRVMGSVAWVNAVRAAHMFARDPEDPARRLFVGMKLNIGKERKGIAYKIAETKNELARIEWLEEVETTADQAVNNDSRPRKVVAAEWLVEQFRVKLEWPSNDLLRAGKEHGISRDALFEAKEKLKLPKPRKTVAVNGDICWTWWVPSDWEGFKTEEPTVGPTVAPSDSCDSCDSSDAMPI